MISVRKRPTNMETRKASSVALVLLCMAPLRMSKYPNWSIWRKVTNYEYFRIEVTLRKTRRPSGARSITPRYIWSSILPQLRCELHKYFCLKQSTIELRKHVLPSFHNLTDWEISIFCRSWPPGEPIFRHFLYLTSFRFKNFPLKVQNIFLHCFSIWCKTNTKTASKYIAQTVHEACKVWDNGILC